MFGPPRLSLFAFLPNETKEHDVDDSIFTYIGSGDTETTFRIPHASIDKIHAIISLRDREPVYEITALPSQHGTSIGGIPLSPRTSRLIPPECICRFGDIRMAVRQTGLSQFERYLPKGSAEELPALVQREVHNRHRARMPILLLRVDDPKKNSERAFTELVPRADPYFIGEGAEIALTKSEHDALGPFDAEEDLAELLVSLTVTPHSVRVMNAGERPIRLGYRILDSGDETIWDRLDMLEVGSAVFALFDPVAYVLNKVKANVSSTRGNSSVSSPARLGTDRTSMSDAEGFPKTPPTDVLLRVHHSIDGRNFFYVTSSLPVHVGRDFTKSVCVLDGSTISRHHASIALWNEEWLVLDANSTNGVLVDGHWVGAHTWTTLGNADRECEVSLGEWRVSVQHATPALVKSIMANPKAIFKELPSKYLALKKDEEDALEILAILRTHDFNVRAVPGLIRQALERIRESTSRSIPTHTTNMQTLHGQAFEARRDTDYIVKILEAREIPVSDDVRERIEATPVRPLFEHWVKKAVTVKTAEELFT